MCQASSRSALVLTASRDFVRVMNRSRCTVASGKMRRAPGRRAPFDANRPPRRNLGGERCVVGPSADVLDDRVEEHEVEAVVTEGSRGPSPSTSPDVRFGTVTRGGGSHQRQVPGRPPMSRTVVSASMQTKRAPVVSPSAGTKGWRHDRRAERRSHHGHADPTGRAAYGAHARKPTPADSDLASSADAAWLPLPATPECTTRRSGRVRDRPRWPSMPRRVAAPSYR